MLQNIDLNKDAKFEMKNIKQINFSITMNESALYLFTI